MNITQYETLMTPHRKNVLTWFETNWEHQKHYSEDGKNCQWVLWSTGQSSIRRHPFHTSELK